MVIHCADKEPIAIAVAEEILRLLAELDKVQCINDDKVQFVHRIFCGDDWDAPGMEVYDDL